MANADLTEDGERLLHVVSLKNLAQPDAVATAIGRPDGDIDDLLSKLEEGGLLETRAGQLRLTDAGQERVASMREDEITADARETLDELYDEFEGPNDRLKQLATDWQMRREDGEQVMNDHSDPAYDARVLKGLYELHEDFRPLLDRMSDEVPRLSMYAPRFDRAVKYLREGDHDYFTKLTLDSYHTVWFEFHEDLIQLLGRERKE